MPDNNQKKGLTADEKNQFDALKSVADFWWERFDKRVASIMKKTFSLWAVLVGYIGIVLSGKVTGFSSISDTCYTLIIPFIGILIFFFHYRYILISGEAHKCDREKFHSYEKEYMRIVDVAFEPEAKAITEKRKIGQTSWKQENHFFILSITAVLIVIAIFVTLTLDNSQKSNISHNSNTPTMQNSGN